MRSTEARQLPTSVALSEYVGSFFGGIAVRALMSFAAVGTASPLAFIAVFSLFSGILEVPLQMWRHDRTLEEATTLGIVDACGVFTGFGFAATLARTLLS